MLEICVDSLESALNAIHGGANELEVCSSLPEGGLTPSVGLVKEVVKVVNNITTKSPQLIHKSCRELCTCLQLAKKPKVNVMLRCRPGSDFQYSQTELDTMLSDLDFFKTMKVDRFVFGAITTDLTVDEYICKTVVTKASPIPVTFHRAFDICKDPYIALETVVKLGFSRILTSGKQSSAVHSEAINLIKYLLLESNRRIQIMPGAGLTYANVSVLKDIGCEIFHGSCKVSKKLPVIGLAMGTNDSEEIFLTDEELVKKFKMAISDCQKTLPTAVP